MVDGAIQLLIVLAAKDQLTESEFTLKESISTFLELHLRAATALLERQLRAGGLLDGDLLDGGAAEPAETGR